MDSELSAIRNPQSAIFESDPDFAMEKPGAQEEVRHWWAIMQAIDDAPRKGAEITRQAGICGEDAPRIERFYYAKWNKARHWRSLINRSKFPEPRDSTLKPAFVEWMAGIYEQFQRQAGRRGTVGERTLTAVFGALRAWQQDPHNPTLAIPGYAEPPVNDPFSHHPHGWSRGNLRRALTARINAYTRAFRAQGPKAAAAFLPKVHTSRAEMYFGEVLYFDDDVLDTYVNLSGVNDKAVRPLAFTCLDGFSGATMARGYKPEIERRDASGAVIGKRQLNQDDFFWFVVHILCTKGWSPNGTALVFEHGTANVDKRDAERFEDHFDNLVSRFTDGKCRVERSGRYRNPAMREMLFGYDGSGNFRFKAPLESWFNLFRNWQSMLPAPTGLSADRAPEESGRTELPRSLLGYNAAMLKQIDRIPHDRFKMLKRPVLEWEDLRWAADMITRIIDARTDHNLEGWDKLGFRSQHYRLAIDAQEWMSEQAYQLIPIERRIELDHIVCRPGYFRSERLSPAAVRDAHLPELRRLPAWRVPLLAPPRLWRPCTVTPSLEIVIEANSADEYADSEDLIFIGKVRNSHGDEINLDRGKKYFRLLNVFNPDTLWIAEADGAVRGRFIGIADRVQTCGKFDHERVLEQIAAISHVRGIESAEVRSRAVATGMDQRLAMRDHNRAVIGGRPVTREEKEQARTDAARVVPMQDFLPTPEEIEAAQEDASSFPQSAIRNPQSPQVVEGSAFL